MVKPYLLIADDDPEDILVIREGLRQAAPEIEVQTVNDGRELLSFLETTANDHLPALMLLDYRMPFLNAAEVLLATAEHAMWKLIPKMVWSTGSQPEDVAVCRQLGAVDYLQKPSSQVELRNITHKIITVWSSVTLAD